MYTLMGIEPQSPTYKVNFGKNLTRFLFKRFLSFYAGVSFYGEFSNWLLSGMNFLFILLFYWYYDFLFFIFFFLIYLLSFLLLFFFFLSLSFLWVAHIIHLACHRRYFAMNDIDATLS